MESDSPSETPRETRLDRHAHAGLERVLARIRQGSPVEEEAVVALAWDYFVAGFTAHGASADELPAPPSTMTPPPADETDFLAQHVAALTPRRLEVLRLVARGLTNREIGRVLDISCYTVKSHLAALFEALDVTNRTEAAFALQRYEAAYPEAHN
ncbi:MAG: LuxR C-terminal-related transcriptional regulator [bacterium]|nr:LuxR C-terminal-related transcriptional regulator [bacterium]